MTFASPCVGVCTLDAATGYCLGCARTGDEIAAWRTQTPSFRAAVWDALPARLQRLGVTGRRLPWGGADIRAFAARTLREGAGAWTMGVLGAVAEFAPTPGACNAVVENGDQIIASNPGGRLRLLIDDQVRALSFGPADAPADRQRIVLAIKRSRGGPPVATALTDLGPDAAAIAPADRSGRLFDVGLGRAEARFCIRCGAGRAQRALAAAAGARLDAALPSLAPTLIDARPARVVETACGRIEVLAPIPAADGRSPAGPHTPLRLDQLAARRATPAGVDLPAAYAPGAIFHPAAAPDGPAPRRPATNGNTM